jgi:NAD(P)-dependent dehydrogenase (short-subunit alcohol dehydrogenase family)
MKTALVTGAGKGLGKGFVDFLSQNGYFVYAGVHRLTDGEGLGSSNVKIIGLDVQDDDSILKTADIIAREKGRLDLLINNAGLNKDSATSGHKELVTVLNSLDRQSLIKMFDVNTISPVMVVKRCLPLMSGPRAFIINISSDRAFLANALDDSNANYGYKASKAALNMMTKVMAFDLPKNVSVVAVHPGGVRTNMNPGGSLEPARAASKIYRIIENWDPKLNGRFVRNDGSLYEL